MAWERFPTVAGTPINRDLFLELVAACTERGISVPTVPVSGSSMSAAVSFLNTLRNNISGEVGPYGITFFDVVSYGGPRDHQIYGISTRPDAANTNPRSDPLPKGTHNLWSLATGESRSTWKYSLSGTRLSHECLNEIQQVLDVLKWKQLDSTLNTLYPSYADDRITRSAVVDDQSPDAAMAAHDGATPQPGADYYGVPVVSAHFGGTYLYFSSDITNPNKPQPWPYTRRDTVASIVVAKTQQIYATGVQFREAIASYTLEGYRAESLLGYGMTWDDVIALDRDVEFIVRYDEADLPAYPARIPYSWGRGVSATQARGPTNNLYTDPDCVALLLDASNGPRSYVNTIYTNAPAVAADAGLDTFPIHPYYQTLHPQLGWQYFNSWQQCHEARWFHTWTALGRLELRYLSA